MISTSKLPYITLQNSPISCDTFVVINPVSKGGTIVFGKNSDRPEEEVQDIVFFPKQDYPAGSTVQCTYIEIEQVQHTFAVVLSKPNWMWGAEMGTNEYGVCIGNEAVYTKLESSKDLDKKLLGMDLLRLGLERGKTALEALKVITALLEQHGQGGPCSNIIKDMTYHNSFIICDNEEAYVLETADRFWAAEKVPAGSYRNISNCLSIGTKIDLMSNGLKDKAKDLNLWSGDGDFDFAKVFSGASPDERYVNGSELLRSLSSSPHPFNALNMFGILRNEESGICMRGGGFVSTSSQVSVLQPAGSRRPNVHWFTGTPDPVLSVFKPFIFTNNPSVCTLLVSPNDKVPHRLYALHAAAVKKGSEVFTLLAQLEKKCYEEMEEFLTKIDKGEVTLAEVEGLFKDCAETEEKFYSAPSGTSARSARIELAML